MNHIRNVFVNPLSWSVTSTGCGFGSAMLFCSDARAQLPLRLVPRPQDMQNGQKWPILLGLCPNHIFCSWGPIMLEILPAPQCVKAYRVHVVEILTDKLLGTCEPNRMWLGSSNQDSEWIQRLYQLFRYNHPEDSEERGKKAIFVVKDTFKIVYLQDRHL